MHSGTPFGTGALFDRIEEAVKPFEANPLERSIMTTCCLVVCTPLKPPPRPPPPSPLSSPLSPRLHGSTAALASFLPFVWRFRLSKPVLIWREMQSKGFGRALGDGEEDGVEERRGREVGWQHPIAVFPTRCFGGALM